MSIDLDAACDQEEAEHQANLAKHGPYANPPDGCPHCSRFRVMIGDDGKHRCEKCCWCIEDGEIDMAMLRAT